MQSEEISRGKPVWKILVVEDDSTVSRFIKMLLEIDGHAVQTASTGREALTILEQNKFDLVTTDFLMSGMKGDSLATAIKEFLPNQRVLMISSKAAFAESCGEPVPNVDLVMGKPFNQKELREAMAKVLQGT
ncbi:MAG TPA: response regulator [Verrucomicrobiae bacterium]|nr:response regulator [Verrucomicrobiae bacterium]